MRPHSVMGTLGHSKAARRAAHFRNESSVTGADPRLDWRERAVLCIGGSGVVEGQMTILYPCGWPCPRCDRTSKP